MGKLDLGILAILGVGVGAFALSKMKQNTGKIDPITQGGQIPQQLQGESCEGYRDRLLKLGYLIDWVSSCSPNQTPNLPPSTIIPTDSEITSGTGQTGVFSGIDTPVVLPTQIENTTPAIHTPIPVENTDQVIEDIFGGQLDPSSQAGIVKQATNINLSRIVLFGFSGQIDIHENIKFFAQTAQGVGVLTYNWDFGDNSVSRGTDKQYANHTYTKEGQYKVKLIVTSNHGASAEKTVTINVIPDPIKQGEVTHKIFPQTNSAIVRIHNNHSQGITGSFSVQLNGANTNRVTGTTHINAGADTDISVSGLSSGYTTFNVDFRPNGSSKDIIIGNNKTVYIEDVPVQAPTPQEQAKPKCEPSKMIQAVIYQLNTVLKSPSWFMSGNVKDVMECKLSETVFMNSYNYLLSTGIITVK